MRLILAAFGLALSSAAFGQASPDSFPDTPENHWVYEALADLRSAGILVGYPTMLGSHNRPWSRYEAAVASHAAAASFHNLALGLISENHRIATDTTNSPDSLNQLKKMRAELRISVPRYRRELLDLTALFAPELKTLGVDMPALTLQIKTDAASVAWMRVPNVGEATRPFTDVPANHWASAATKNLRLAGVLQGYGDGTFGGSR